MNMRWISLLVSYHFLSFILFSRVNPIRELIIIEPVVCETNLTYIGFVSLKYGIYDIRQIIISFISNKIFEIHKSLSIHFIM